MSKEEYQKRLIAYLEEQSGQNDSHALYLRYLLDRLGEYAPLDKKTIERAKKIVENNKAFEQADFKEEFGEDLEELFQNKKELKQ